MPLNTFYSYSNSNLGLRRADALIYLLGGKQRPVFDDSLGLEVRSENERRLAYFVAIHRPMVL